jgi:preprotein translocase subunit SecA
MLETITKAFRYFVPDFNTRFLRSIAHIIDDIEGLEDDYKKLSDQQLRAKTDEFRERLKKGETLDDLLVPAFATVREAADRVLNMRPYRVQLIGGVVLHRGLIAEMKTGEGKTLVATLPLYLNALAGKGAHLVTVNDYLARRDSEWMGRVYNFLGLTTGLIVHDLNPQQRRAAYHSDITYGTNNEFGFDYLRDNMAIEEPELSQRDLHYCIVDEVDSILIDEARTPLIISGPADTASEDYVKFAQIVPRLKRGRDYTVEEKAHQVTPTEEGIAEVERLASKAYGVPIDNLYAPEHMKKVHYLTAALKAKELYERDKSYVVTTEGEIQIVDEFTGRIMPGRRWSDGIHQSIEAKEGVPIVRENQTLGSITFQNLFRMYGRLSGMTGTAVTEAKEFGEIYKLDVVAIPTNRPLARDDMPDVILKSEREKYQAIADHLEELHSTGQPVLVGTVDIDTSELLHGILQKRGVPHEVLNAKHHQREALIVAQAGRKGSVTIATNMAGRGTDIMLGGNPEGLTMAEVGPSPRFEFKAAPTPEGLSHQEARQFSNQQSLLSDFWRQEKCLWQLVRENLDSDFDQLQSSEQRDDLAHAIKEAHADLLDEIDESGHVQIGERFYGTAPSTEDLKTSYEHMEEQYNLWLTAHEEWQKKHDETLERFTAETEKEKPEVIELGGLFILGTERHDSRRIDNQLRGRSGRQGDPGASQFYISMEDKLMRLFGGEWIRDKIQMLGWEEGEALEHEWIDKAVENSQGKVEGYHFDIRKNVLKYDDVMNDQRKFIYGQRRTALEESDLSKHIQVMIDDVVENLMEAHCNIQVIEDEWDLEALSLSLGDLFALDISAEQLGKWERSEMQEEVQAAAHKLYEEREKEIGAEMTRRLERIILLQIIDEQWKDHLYSMDGLQEGIGLQGYAGKDPLVEYKIAATSMFNELLERVRTMVVQYLFRLEFQAPQQAEQMEQQLHEGHDDQELFYGGGDPEAKAPTPPKARATKRRKVGRNDPCPCGSGKKYKKCCG